MKPLLIILMFSSCALLSAQELTPSKDSTLAEWSFKTAEKKIKFSPLDVISVIPTLGADIEVTKRKDLGLQAGVGIILPGIQFFDNLSNNSFNRMNGYKLRFESRFYSFRKPTQYFGVELCFRHLIIDQTVGIGMEPSTQINQFGEQQQSYAYFIDTDMIFHRFNTYLNAKFGFQKITKGGALIDLYAGLSLRKIITRTWSEIPEGGAIPANNSTIFMNLGDKISRSYITPIVGLKIGLVMKPKNQNQKTVN